MLANLYKVVKINLQGQGVANCGNKANRINSENNQNVESRLFEGLAAPLDRTSS
jgi:hypothetical protein